MIYTSYYANLRNIPKHITRVVISVTHPEWIFDEESKKLEWSTVFPPKELLWNYKAGNISDEEYTDRYIQHLNDNCAQIRKELHQVILSTKDSVLLCWCGPTKFCHRHILADWLNLYLKIKVVEYE